MNLIGPDILIFALVVVGVFVGILGWFKLVGQEQKDRGDLSRLVTARLQALDTLLDSGTITEQEHVEQRRRILGEL